MKHSLSLPILLALLLPFPLAAQVSYTEAEAEYVESFNQLAHSGSSEWEDGKTVPGWSAWFSLSGTPERYAAYDGTSSAGGLRSFGPIGSRERALGLATGSHFGDGMIGVAVMNETGQRLDEITVSYVGQLWRGVGSGGKALNVEYRVGGPEELKEGEWTPIEELVFHVPKGEGHTAFDGTLPENSQKLTASVSGVQWENGQTLHIRFVQANDEQNKHLAIDQFTLSAR